METLDWIINWFNKEKSISVEELKQNTEINYFENGYINSLAFVNLLVDIETEFGISLENDDFADEKFFTLSGTANAIKNKLETKG